MNREQRRKYTKHLKSKGFSEKQIDFIIKSKQLQEESVTIPEGTKVKLNVKQIKKHPTYQRLTEKYKQWIDSYQDYVFTVEYDKNKKDNPKLVCLAEDTTNPKWLFWIGDLNIIKET